MTVRREADGWESHGVVEPGGTVVWGAAAERGAVWLATEAGAFRHAGDGWSQPPALPPLASIRTVAAGGTTCLVGGVGGSAYSTDNGRTWHRSASDHAAGPVTCVALSPSWEQDGVAFAGTDDTGILRSSDGGRSWQLANFGLEHFSVLALAAAPNWQRREVAFAAMVDGFYRSGNGGRAWQLVDLGSRVGSAQTIAVSPGFAGDGTVLVGTERGGILRSVDGGRTWAHSGSGIGALDRPPPINALWLCPDIRHAGICLAATADGVIFRSEDGGATWAAVLRGPVPVLCLFDAGGTVYAGLEDEGLLASIDLGVTWRPESLAARGLTRLTAGGDGDLYAFGPLAGVWSSADGGSTWARMEPLRDERPIQAFAAGPDGSCLLAGTRRGLVVSQDGGQTWRATGVRDQVLTIARFPEVAAFHRAYAGTRQGTVARSDDAGMTWDVLPSASPQAPTVAVAELPLGADENLLVKVTVHPREGNLVVWRTFDSADWEVWLRSTAERGEAYLAADSSHGVAVACLDRACWHCTHGHWHLAFTADSPFLGLKRRLNPVGFLAFTAERFYRSADGVRWDPWFDGPPDAPLVDATVTGEGDRGTMHALTIGGGVWERRLPVVAGAATVRN